jgi:hypothetical protein
MSPHVPTRSRRFRPAAAAALAVFALSLSLVTACGADTETIEPDDPAARLEAGAGAIGDVGGAPGGSIDPPAGPVRVGTTLEVTFHLDDDRAPGAWLGLIPAEHAPRDEPSNDAVDVAWVRLEPERSDAELALGAAPPGSYRLRIFSADDEAGTLLAESAPFEVVAWELLTDDTSVLTARLAVTVDGRELAAGSTLPSDAAFQVLYEVSQELPDKAWLGLVPASVTALDEDANDAADVQFEYVDGTSGTVEMVAPEAGDYVLRLFPCDEAVCSAIAQLGPFRSPGAP